MKRVYGVMLIGCGYIGQEHLADIYYRDNVRVAAVIDKDPERAMLTARKYQAAEYGTDYTLYLERKEIDIVIIATYVDTHLSIMEDCVKAGKHVLCEKPVAANREDGERFFQIAQSAGTQVMVGHILRYNKSYQKIYQLIRQGAIGKLKWIHIVQNHHALNWNRYRRLLEDCPPLLDCGVHYLDVMQWMSGEKITSIVGNSLKLDEESPCNNHGMVFLKFSGGLRGCYESGWSRNLKAYNCKEFVGEKGYIRLTLQADRTSNKEEGDLIEVYHSDTGQYETLNLQSVYKNMNAQFQELVNRIEGSPQNSFSLQDAKEAFAAAMSAVESSDISLKD